MLHVIFITCHASWHVVTCLWHTVSCSLCHRVWTIHTRGRADSRTESNGKTNETSERHPEEVTYHIVWCHHRHLFHPQNTRRFTQFHSRCSDRQKLLSIEWSLSTFTRPSWNFCESSAPRETPYLGKSLLNVRQSRNSTYNVTELLLKMHLRSINQQSGFSLVLIPIDSCGKISYVSHQN